MRGEYSHTSAAHLTDEELLLAADGELASGDIVQVKAHLAACWDCRARMTEIEETIAGFIRVHRRTFDSQLPPVAGPRALLRARLAELAAQPEAHSWSQFFRFRPTLRVAACLLGVVFTGALAGSLLLWHSPLRNENSAVLAIERGTTPNHNLTPGATRRVSIGDVCSMPHEEVVRAVPTSVRQEIFQEYGIENAQASNYEIDYLITPGLGGAEDLHNLWPEPYTPRAWNAHTKDDLEEHLHEMVCSGQLDLLTAQREIATDWISAYKKYFHTDSPSALPARLGSKGPGTSKS